MNAEHKKSVLQRLRNIEGHVRGVERMVQEDQYCIDILNQILAIQRALDKVNTLVLGNHLNTCVTTAIRSEEGDERERVIEEILEVFETSSKL